MRFETLKNRVKHFKEEGGRGSMCKSVEDYGKKVAKEVVKEEKEKTISTLLKNGMTVDWIHDTLNYPIKLIEQVQKSIGK